MSKIIRKHYETLSDLIADAEKGSKSQESHEKGQKDFYGTNSFPEAVALAGEGWPEGAAKVAETRASLDGYVREVVAAKGRGFDYDVAAGEWLDVGRFLSGEPECFGVTVEGDTLAAPVVRLVANISASGAVSTKSLFKRGAAILSAIDVLEACGRRVELTVGFASRGYDVPKLECSLLAKAAGQPVEPDRLAFLLCHAAFLRRIAFSVYEQNGHRPSATRPADYTPEDGQIVTPEALRGTDFTAKELQAHVRDICALAGVEIPEFSAT
jgi:hypothetical protein